MNCPGVVEPEEPLLWEYGTKSPAKFLQSSLLLSNSPPHLRRRFSCCRNLPQTFAEVLAAPKYNYANGQMS